MYRRQLTFSAGLADFTPSQPVCARLRDPLLRHLACGGHVRDEQARDLSLTDGEGQPLPHRVAEYDPATGDLTLLAQVGSSTELWLGYGGAIGDGAAPVGGLAPALDAANGRGAPASEAAATVAGDRLASGFTVEAWLSIPDTPHTEGIQCAVSAWQPKPPQQPLAAYDAGMTDGQVTRGFFGAVCDGRYVYFVPQYDGTGDRRHGKVLRYDTRLPFAEAASWQAYDAGRTAGLDTRGYYGACADGRYVWFVPRFDGQVHHTRLLRYDSRIDFDDPAAWDAHEVGLGISYQSCVFDGRFLYLLPGYASTPPQAYTLKADDAADAPSGVVLRVDTFANLHDPAAYTTYDAAGTDGLACTCYDGGVFDGRYVYLAPLQGTGDVLRYDTAGEFTAPESWAAVDTNRATGDAIGWFVGGVFDGRYVYLAPYSAGPVVRYDTKQDFRADAGWATYGGGPALSLDGYDGAAFDGRYVYFIPFHGGGDKAKKEAHGRILRYDTTAAFDDHTAWNIIDGGAADGLEATGYNGGAFDGRFLYLAPWRQGTATDGKPIVHGNVMRYDTVGDNGLFCLRAADLGHNGGLCAALPGPSFLLNTRTGAVCVRSNAPLPAGRHHLAATFDGERVCLYVDGKLAGATTASPPLDAKAFPLAVGHMPGGRAELTGTLLGWSLTENAATEPAIAASAAFGLGRDDAVALGPEVAAADS